MLMRWFGIFLVSVVFSSTCFAEESSHETYDSISISNQSSASYGTSVGVAAGFGYRVGGFGLGVEGHFLFPQNSNNPSGQNVQGLYLGKIEFFPIGHLGFAGLWGPGVFYFAPNGEGFQNLHTTAHFAGARITYEAQIGKRLSIEPNFAVLQRLGTDEKEYLFSLTFSFWNPRFVQHIFIR